MLQVGFVAVDVGTRVDQLMVEVREVQVGFRESFRCGRGFTGRDEVADTDGTFAFINPFRVDRSTRLPTG